MTSCKIPSLYPLMSGICKLTLTYPKYKMADLPIPSNFNGLSRLLGMHMIYCCLMQLSLAGGWLHSLSSPQEDLKQMPAWGTLGPLTPSLALAALEEVGLCGQLHHVSLCWVLCAHPQLG